MGNQRIARLTNSDADFYSLIGPFLSRREIVKELGFPIWDDSDKTWFVASERGRVMGFAAVRFEKRKAVLCSAYVLPDHRRKGIYKKLAEARLAWIASLKGQVDTIASVATEASLPLLKKKGFKVVRAVGRYTHVNKEITL
jgi:GNAT superfamily N-acetyltransferase